MIPASTPIRAISLDFGNTLVPVGRADLHAVVRLMTARLAERSGPFDEGEFGAAWAAERERQFAEEVPRMREVDLAQRVVRVLARMRGMAAPARTSGWDDAAAARLSTTDEVETALAEYSRAFVETIPAPPEVGPLLDRLANRYVLGICSNWPLAATIDRFVENAGWRPYLSAVVVSQRSARSSPIRGCSRPPSWRCEPRPGRSSMSATTGRPTSSGPSAPAGGRPTSSVARPTRRCPTVSPMGTSSRTSSSAGC